MSAKVFHHRTSSVIGSLGRKKNKIIWVNNHWQINVAQYKILHEPHPARYTVNLNSMCYFKNRKCHCKSISTEGEIPPSPLLCPLFSSLPSLPTTSTKKPGSVNSLFAWLHGANMVFEKNKIATMLVYQTNPLGVEFLSYVDNLFCYHKSA